MALTSAADLNNSTSGKLVKLIEANSIAMKHGRVQYMQQDRTSVLLPVLATSLDSSSTLETTSVTATDPSLLPAGGTFQAYKARVTASSEFQADAVDMPWADLASLSIARRIDADCLANASLASTLQAGVLSAATLAQGVAALPAEDLGDAALIMSPSQAAAVHELMLSDGTVKGLPVYWTDQHASGIGGALMSMKNLMVIVAKSGFSMSRDDQAGAMDDMLGFVYRARLVATTVTGAAIVTFADA